MKNENERAVLVCTEYRGVFFGYASDTSGDTVDLRGAKMAIYWGTDKGVAQLARTGPTSTSRIGAEADVQLRKVTAVFEVTSAAESVWGKS